MKDSSYPTLAAFRALCPVMAVYSIFSLAFPIAAYLGFPLPFDLLTFESTAAVRAATVIAGLIALAVALLGRRAAVKKKAGLLKVCGSLSILMIVLYCVIMFLADGHANPHVWILLGSTSIVPGSFAGYALRLAVKGWDDTCG